MWSFSRNPSLSVDSDNSNLSPVIPDQALGTLPFISRGEPVMDTGRIALRKFYGYPSEDPDQFLLDFEAYCTFSRIVNDDCRKVAAFQLHLQGPAQTWFCCLDAEERCSWESVKTSFQDKYCIENNPPVLLVETEQFSSLHLSQSQQIEDYFSKILEKGKKISKSDQEILLKFIQGLPAQLAFFVRAGNPADVHAALTSAKMGEAFGYRVTPGMTGDVATVAAASREDSSDWITKLEQTVNKLGDTIERLLVSPGRAQSNSTNTGRINNGLGSSVYNQRVCFNCSAMGHLKRRCNLASGQGDPNSTCQLCSQRGHRATQCKLFMDNPNMDNSGNANSPRNAGRGPLGGRI